MPSPLIKDFMDFWPLFNKFNHEDEPQHLKLFKYLPKTVQDELEKSKNAENESEKRKVYSREEAKSIYAYFTRQTGKVDEIMSKEVAMMPIHSFGGGGRRGRKGTRKSNRRGRKGTRKH